MRGATQLVFESLAFVSISIHAPHAGGDFDHPKTLHRPLLISIHAPHAGGDVADGADAARILHFNPRPPCGGRPYMDRIYQINQEFQSTPPMRGATLQPQSKVRL